MIWCAGAIDEPPTALVWKPWDYSNSLRDNGLSWGDYFKQPTWLWFRKMADEQSRSPYAAVAPTFRR